MALAKSARASPTLRYQEGGLLWNVQCSVFPPSPLASIAITICGLIQSIFVSVPVTEMRLPISKIAEGEWCAHTDEAADISRTATGQTEILCITIASLSGVEPSITRLSPRGPTPSADT